jgi:hypothetical protein
VGPGRRKEAGGRLEGGWREAGGRLEGGQREAGERPEAGRREARESRREARGRPEAGWREGAGHTWKFPEGPIKEKNPRCRPTRGHRSSVHSSAPKNLTFPF